MAARANSTLLPLLLLVHGLCTTQYIHPFYLTLVPTISSGQTLLFLSHLHTPFSSLPLSPPLPYPSPLPIPSYVSPLLTPSHGLTYLLFVFLSSAGQ